MRRTLTTALAGALVALVIVGGFVALDRTTLHFYTDSTDSADSTEIEGPEPTMAPKFTESQAIAAVKGQLPYPLIARMEDAHCNGEYVGNATWSVVCRLFVDIRSVDSLQFLLNETTMAFSAGDDDTADLLAIFAAPLRTTD